MISAHEALERLRQGNRRFVADTEMRSGLVGWARRRGEVAAGQEPFAVVLGCSDSRVPVEIVFDQGLGDLFVIRVAGNVVAPSQLGSIEFAAQQLGTRLVVVLGHSHCGAVLATLQELQRPPETRSANLGSIVDRIRPSVEGLLASGCGDPDASAARAVRANIHASVDQVKRGSAIIEGLVERNGLLVVGAEYSLETGFVQFLEVGSRH